MRAWLGQLPQRWTNAQEWIAWARRWRRDHRTAFMWISMAFIVWRLITVQLTVQEIFDGQEHIALEIDNLAARFANVGIIPTLTPTPTPKPLFERFGK